jgi:hypothetical protein
MCVLRVLCQETFRSKADLLLLFRFQQALSKSGVALVEVERDLVVIYCCRVLSSAGVTSFEVDLASKKVVVMGDVTPFEVLESVSKVAKFAQLWTMATN